MISNQGTGPANYSDESWNAFYWNECECDLRPNLHLDQRTSVQCKPIEFGYLLCPKRFSLETPAKKYFDFMG